MNNKKNKLSIGSWITLGHPSIAEIMCKAGFDWLAIDLEHSSITLKEAEELIRVINLCKVKPFVRLTSNNSDQIKRVLDSGAEGIIVPMVNCYKDAVNAVEACYYPPLGKRSVGLARAQKYGAGLKEYIKWKNKNLCLIVQIEHVDAIDNLEEIFSIKKINGYMIGPYDLSASLGIPGDFDNKIFKNAVKTIIKIASKFKLKKGIHVVEPDTKIFYEKIKEGFDMIAYSLDIRMLDVACKNVTAKIQKIK
jgi:2-keto-3-deoxy-L-rhamnonate aldolase RhmA